MHKIAFYIGSFPIHWYGVLLATGCFLGLWTASRRAQLDRIPAHVIIDGGAWLILGAIIGARALYVISYWDRLVDDPRFPNAPWLEIFMVRRGGLVFYGGLIGAIAAGMIYARRAKIPLWKFADAIAPSIPLGYVLGRIGCLMNGCCFGRPTDLPWGIRFPDHETRGVPVHPTQLYDASLSLLLYLGLAWLYRRKRFDGQIFAAYLIAYAVLRSFVEAFRGDYPVRYLGIATPAHLVSLLILLAGIVLLIKLPRVRVSSTPLPPT